MTPAQALPAVALPSAAPGPAWSALRYLSFYRAVLAGMFVVLVLWGTAPRLMGQFDITLFGVTAGLYLVFGIATVAASILRWPAFEVQVAVQVTADIAAITLLMHASGGPSSGLGMLLVVAIAGGSILTEGRIAILFAALATLAVLGEQIYTWLVFPFRFPDYPHAGMLGAAFFATAYLAYVSARRIRASDAAVAQAEFDLANLEQLSDHIVQRMQSGIVAVDSDLRIRLMNRSARGLLGVDEQVIGQRLTAVLPGLAALLSRWRGYPSLTAQLYRPGHAQLELQASFASLGPGGGTGALVFLEDAAAMRQRAHQLKLASLGQLAASIAHEIRNPLGAVSHANQLLVESDHLDPADQRLTRIIADNATRMNGIVENVLRLSRRGPAAPETLALGSWLADFTHEFSDAIELAPGTLELRPAPEELSVRVDPSQLHQVLWNLCENGVRHGAAPARVTLESGISAETRRPYLEVTDNGEGLDPEEAERVFEPFYTTRAEGTGLGLYIARELCESNQASLQYMGRAPGARFRITFSDPRRSAQVHE